MIIKWVGLLFVWNHKHLYNKTGRARELEFLHNVHQPTARKCLQSWNMVDLPHFTKINIPHSLPVHMSVFLYIQMCPQPPPWKKLNQSPIPPTKNDWTPSPTFLKLHPKKRIFFKYWCFLSALVERVFVPLWIVFNGDFIQ